MARTFIIANILMLFFSKLKSSMCVFVFNLSYLTYYFTVLDIFMPLTGHQYDVSQERELQGPVANRIFITQMILNLLFYYY